jgi:hypothetical protein
VVVQASGTATGLPPGPAHQSDVRTVEVICAAVAAFNAGDQLALGARAEDDQPAHVSAGVYPQELLGCNPGRVCRSSRPMPLVAGKSEVSLKAISLLDDGRAVCTLTTVDAQLVGMYAVADERIVAGCHYFSDLDLLSRIGTLPPHHTAQRAPRREEAGDGSGPATLGDVLLEGRLAHRHERLRLVIHALDERLAALTASERVVPAALLAAIEGFQKELAHVRGELHALRRPSHQRPPDNKREAP